MISRRNIRVKVMQELYALQTSEGIQEKLNPVDNLQKSLQFTSDLFVYLLYFITEVARYAEKDARLRASKNLPSAEDRNVNTKISGNELLWRILENESFKKEKAARTLAFEDTEEQVKKTYNQLTSTDNYRQYIAAQGRDKKIEKDTLVFIFTNLMLPSESFVQLPHLGLAVVANSRARYKRMRCSYPISSPGRALASTDQVCSLLHRADPATHEQRQAVD